MKKKSFISAFAFGIMALAFSSCKRGQEVSTPSSSNSKLSTVSDVTTGLLGTSGTLVFQSNFEGGTVNGGTNPLPVQVTSDLQDIIGNSGDQFVSSSWTYNLEQAAPNKWHNFRLNYEGATSAQASAAIISNSFSNPASNSSPKILRFEIHDAIIDNVCGANTKKARVQGELTSYPANGAINASGVKEYYQTAKLYIPGDFIALQSSVLPDPNSCDWLSIFEYHDKTNGAAGADNNDFRMTVYIDKDSQLTGSARANAPLRFRVEGDDGPKTAWVTKWGFTNSSYAIPIGTWIETQVYIKESYDKTGANVGRFWLAVRNVNSTDSNPWTVIADVKDRTVRTGNTNPTGMTDWSPLKLYCSGHVVDTFNAAGKTLHIYWDDVKIYENKTPDNLTNP